MSRLFSGLVNARDNAGKTRLWRAVDERNVVEVAFLLKLKPNLELGEWENPAHTDLHIYHRRTPLYVACEAGDERIVAMLLDAGANVAAEARGQTQWKSPFTDTPLKVSIRMRRLNIVQMLLAACDVDCARAALGDACWGGVAFVDAFVKAHSLAVCDLGTWYATPPLQLSIETRNFAVAEFLLRLGVDPNAPGINRVRALHRCVVAMPLFVPRLLRAGAVVDATDGLGKTALDEALSGRTGRSFMSDVVLTLLAAGADFETAAKAWTADSSRSKRRRMKRGVRRAAVGVVRERARTVLFALQDLELPALLSCMILEEDVAPFTVDFHVAWSIVTTVKHFRDRQV
jgi:ankyrin repeat protein